MELVEVESKLSNLCAVGDSSAPLSPKEVLVEGGVREISFPSTRWPSGPSSPWRGKLGEELFD